MKIAVSATSGSLDAQVSEQFGRCAYFLVVETDTMKFEPVSNPGQGMMGGAGPEAVRTIASKGVEVVITGQVGPNAQQALDAASIRVITGYGESVTVKDAVQTYVEEQKGVKNGN